MSSLDIYNRACRDAEAIGAQIAREGRADVMPAAKAYSRYRDVIADLGYDGGVR